MLASVAHVHSDETLTFFVLHPGDLTESHRQQLQRSCCNSKIELRLVAVQPEWLNDLPSLSYIPVEMWLRVFLPQVLPTESRVLYLDCDTLVMDSLEPLWSIDLGGKQIAAVTTPLEPQYKRWPERLGLGSGQQYFGSGVLLMDLGALRNSGAMSEVIAYGKNNADWTLWGDQDALNAVLGHRRLDLHPRWNLMNSIALRYETDNIFDDQELEHACKYPAIVHFEGHTRSKPWHPRCQHPYRDQYFRFLSQGAWGGQISIRKRIDALMARIARRRSSAPKQNSSRAVLRTADIESALGGSKPASISVVIPTHNRADIVGVAIASALHQTVDVLEVIVVDDGSSDNTAEVVATYQSDKLRYIRNERALGSARTRNRGIEEARGDLIAFLDDDDMWFADKLRRQYTELWNRGALHNALGLCGYVRLEGTKTSTVFDPSEAKSLDFTRGFDSRYRVINTSGWLVSRDLLLQAGGFDEKMPNWEDWELAIRLRELADFVYVAEPLLCYNRNRPPGVIENWQTRQPALDYVTKKHAKLWDHRPRSKANNTLQYVLMVRHRISRQAVLKGALAAIKIAPWFLAAYFWALTYSGLPGAKKVGNRLARAFPRLQGW